MKRLALIGVALVLLVVTGCAQNPRSSSPGRDPSLVDLNAATAAQLQRLPGITAVYARRIIANRPYKVKHELETRKILPPSVYARIRDRVIAIERIPDL
ncbi:MAG TPA: helix-hairpin-helix domain-containing protein [Vicinamibacterales bacterium]|nr:helix-hairpin-helix domain-containing protein [Vicinamibacterales bacterium]